MAAKICVTYSGNLSAEKVAALRTKVADALGVLVADVIALRDAAIHTFVVPDALIAKAQEKILTSMLPTHSIDPIYSPAIDHAEDEAS